MEKKEEIKQEVEEKKTDNKTETKKDVKVKDENKKEEVKKETTKPKTEGKDKKENSKKEVKKETKKEPNKKIASKNENKKEVKKSKNKAVLTIILVIILIAAIACGGYFLTLNYMKTGALNEVDAAFTALKSGDEEIIKQYLGEESAESMTEEIEDENGKEMAKIMLSHLNYEIVSSDVNLKECVVKLNVSNKDLKTVFSNYMKKAFSLAFSQAFGQMTEDEMNTQLQKYFEEQYNSESVETITSELTVTMTKKDGKWNMDADEKQVINAILPGYEDVIDSISSMQD